MPGTADLLEAQVLGDAHDHLHKDCPWFRHVQDGGGSSRTEDHCKPATGKSGPPRLVVKFTTDDVDWVELTPRTPEASTVPEPTVPPGGPGLFHIKGRELPPYIQHLWHHLAPKYGKQKAYGMAVGIVKKWAAGVNPGGWDTKSGKGKRTHADVRAAAAKNVAMWEKDKADAHKQHGSDHAKATASLAQPASGPSGYGQYGLWQHPTQSLAPSGPTPPEVTLPTPDECTSLAGQVPDSTDQTLSNTARVFLRAAGRKLELDDREYALMALRGAQTALAAAHKADVNLSLPAQFEANVPDAERSSATTAMLQSRAKADQWRTLEIKTATMIDRMRKRFFHGQLNSQVANARLSGEPMSDLDRLLSLADASAHDVSEPSTSDLSARAMLMQPRGVSPAAGKAAEELAGLAPLDKVRVQAHVSRANATLNTNRYTAAQAFGQAKMVAAEAGAHHLARHYHQSIEVLAAMGNFTNPQSLAEQRPASAFDSHDAPQSGNHTLAATLALAAGAGSSAGSSAGTPGPRTNTGTSHPVYDAHQLHEMHVKHVAHVAHEHVEHLAHVAVASHAMHVAHVEHTAKVAAKAAATTKVVAKKK